ncbi:hypothetical protein BGZ76_005207 [Entomortierella beljakovae]|nr:hypothetical protein BGZ76_005207 [Entomortierella beljakovae]
MPTSKGKSTTLNENGEQSNSPAQSKRRRAASPANTEFSSPSPKRQKELAVPTIPIPDSPLPPVHQKPTAENEGGVRLNNITNKDRIEIHLDDDDKSDDGSEGGDNEEGNEDANEDDGGDDTLSRNEGNRRGSESPSNDNRDDGDDNDNTNSNTNPVSIPRGLGSKRGKYRPRIPRGWGVYFQHRNPIVGEDGSIEYKDDVEETRNMIFNRWRKMFNLWDPSRESTKPPESSGRNTDNTDATTDADTTENGEVPFRGTFMETVKKQLERELSDGTWNDWVAEPPDLKYPYLHNAFPYEKYKPPDNRIDDSSHGPLPKSLPLDWYKPQGPVVNEDFFSLEKFNYATKMMKMINVEPDPIRMDVYFHRGFELASRKMADRIRLNNRKDHPANANQDNTQRNRTASRYIDVNRQQVITPSLPTGSTSSRPPGSTSSQHQSVPRTVNTDLEASRGSTNHMEFVYESSSARSKNSSRASISGPSNLSRVQQNSHPSEPNLIEGLQSNSEPPNTPSRTNINPVTIQDYYEVNKYLSNLFVPSKDKSDPEPPVSPGAARILQTMLSGLETKILGMGCHRQREELTTRIGLIDTENTAMKVLKSKSRGAQLRKNYHSQYLNNASSSPSITPSILISPESASTQTKYSRSTNPAYRSLRSVDMDHYIYRTSDDIRNGNSVTDGINQNESVTSTPASSSTTPASSSTTFRRSRGPSKSSSPFAETSARSTRERSMSMSTMASSDEEIDENQFEFSPLKPYVSNPLMIPRNMDPFSKARDYLEMVDARSRGVIMDFPSVPATVTDPGSVSSSDLDSGSDLSSDSLDSDIDSDSDLGSDI